MTLGFAIPGDLEMPTREQIETLLNAWEKRKQVENQDRTSAIVKCVDLEQILERVILDIMIDDQIAENALKHTFSSFYAKIQLAHCLGLTSPDEYTDLNTIRQIRNYFAHSPSGSTFEDPKIVTLCQDLRIPHHKESLFSNLTYLEIFDATVFVLSENIWGRRVSAKQYRCSKPDEVNPEKWMEFF